MCKIEINIICKIEYIYYIMEEQYHYYREYYNDDSDETSSTMSDQSEIDDVYYNNQDYHDDAERSNGKYYIGLCKLYIETNNYLLLNVVHPESFFKFYIDNILRYLQVYSLIFVSNPEIDIIQVKYCRLSDNSIQYNCIKKTHYIRMIQRCWKRQMRRRREIIKRRTSLFSIQCRQRTGKWPIGLNVLPGLYGMYYENTNICV